MVASSVYAADLDGDNGVLRSTELSEGVEGIYFSASATDRTNYAAGTFHPSGENWFYGTSRSADIDEVACDADPCTPSQTKPTTYNAILTIMEIPLS